MRDYDAERRVLSAMMHSERACIEVADTLEAEDFTDAVCRDMFTLASGLFIRGVRPTLAEVLKEGVALGYINARNMGEIRDISESHIEDANIRYWVEKVRDARRVRDVASALRKFEAKLADGVKDVNAFIAELNGSFFALAMETDDEGIEDPNDVADLGIKLLDERVQEYRRMQEDCRLLGEVPLEGVPTGIRQLDRSSLGLKPGDLVILGAETGHGKTAFALNVARAACLDSAHKVLYVNTEMSREQIARRWGAMLSSVALNQIRAGSVTNEQKETVVQAYNRLRRAGFYPCSVPTLTPAKLDILARKAKLQKDVDLIIVDYVGRMEKVQKDMTEWQVLERIIKTQKIMAQTLGVAVLVLVQLNEDGSLQGAKRMKNECDLMLKLLPVDEDMRRSIERSHGKDYEDFDSNDIM